MTLTKIRLQITVPPERLNSLAAVLSSPPHSYMLTKCEIRFLRTDDTALATNGLTSEERRSLERFIEALESDSDVVKAWTGRD
jgi:transcriptional/translational regulatory protein YebC/TACO1